ncbi:unnamed protein product [Malus baccata var. baccata]
MIINPDKLIMLCHFHNCKLRDHLQLLQASKGKEVISKVSHLKISSHIPMVDSGNQIVQQECNPQPRMDLGNSNSKRGQSPRRWT